VLSQLSDALRAWSRAALGLIMHRNDNAAMKTTVGNETIRHANDMHNKGLGGSILTATAVVLLLPQ